MLNVFNLCEKKFMRFIFLKNELYAGEYEVRTISSFSMISILSITTCVPTLQKIQIKNET